MATESNLSNFRCQGTAAASAEAVLSLVRTTTHCQQSAAVCIDLCLLQACSQKLAANPSNVRALLIRASSYVKKGAPPSSALPDWQQRSP